MIELAREMINIIPPLACFPPKRLQTGAGSDGEDPLRRGPEYSDRLLASGYEGYHLLDIMPALATSWR